MNPEELAKFFGGCLIFTLAATIIKDIYHQKTHCCIPLNKRVENVALKRLRFEFLDLNENGTNEFLLNYDRTRYLLRTNRLGKLFLQEYNFVPREHQGEQ